MRGSDASRVIAYYKAGLSFREITAETGVPQVRARGILHGAGIPLRGGGRPRSAVLPPAAEVAARYEAGESTIDLGRAYGEHPSAIGGIIEGAGVPLRSPGEARARRYARMTPAGRAHPESVRTAMSAGQQQRATADLVVKLRRRWNIRLGELYDAALEAAGAERDILLAQAGELERCEEQLREVVKSAYRKPRPRRRVADADNG